VEEEELLANILRHKNSLFVYDRHYYLHSVANSKNEKINMMNMVREPVNRLISQFYYLRSIKRWNGKKERPPKEWMEKDFDVCVRSGDLECQVGGGGQDMQLTYFCGSDLRCANSSDPMVLQVAKHNLENRFSVVGVVEHYNISVAVLESYLPAFFRGANKKLSLSSGSKKNVNPHPEPKSNVREILRQRLKLDIEFYEFAKQRLLMQWNRIKAKL